MLYENYQKKILKVAEVLAKIVRLLPVIIPSVALVLAAIIALLAVKGNIGNFTCDTDMVYGEYMQCEAKAFLSRVWYEYSDDGVDWSEEYPKMPGKYWVRAVSNASFGGKKYSEPISFTISKKSLTVSVADQDIIYGDKLNLSADVAYKDIVVCDRYVADDGWLATGVANESSANDFLSGTNSFLSDLTYNGEGKVCTITPDKSYIKVLDERGKDVTAAYDIDVITTQITLKKRSLSVKIEDLKKVYDGELLSGGECAILSGSLAEGDEIVATFKASLVNAGSVTNIPDFKIVNEQGNEVTGYYTVSISIGMLVVEKRPVTISFADDNLEYAGIVWYDKRDYEIDPDTPLVDGHRVVCSGGTELNDCGTYKNQTEVEIFDSYGNNVTENYKLNIDRGTITVTPKPLYISTNNHKWLYDSIEHYDLGFSSNGLVSGQILYVDGFPSLTDVGVIKNDLEFGVMMDNGTEVSIKNYAITYSYGTLEVTPRKLHVITHNGSWTYDGTLHEAIGFDQSGDKILSHQTVEVVNATSIKNVGTAENKFEIKIYDGYEVTKNYEITYSYGTLEITPRYLYITTWDGYWTYDGDYHDALGFDQSGDTILSHQTYDIIGAPNIRDAGSITNEFRIEIYDYYYYEEDDSDSCEVGVEKAYPVTDNYVIKYVYGTLTVEKRHVSLSTQSYTWKYDRKEHYYHEYIATSDLGIVDGEEVEFTGWASIIDVGSVANTFTSYKIIRTENGVKEDITYRNYIVEWDYGTLTIEPRPIVCKPVDESKVYDATPLVPLSGEIAEGVSEYGLLEGDYLKVKLSGSITDAGTAESILTSVLVFNSAHQDVSHCYEIEKIPGVLEVLRRQITVYTGSASKQVYDKKPLTNSEYGVYPDKLYDLVSGHKLYATVIGSQTDAGESDNICDEEKTYILGGGRDVTANYDIRYEYGKLSVKPYAVIYVTSASDWKYWDGTPLTNDGYECSIRDGELRTNEGHTLVIKVTGSITDIGVAPNTLSVSVVDRSGKDVSIYYKIVATEGELEIKEKPGDDSSEMPEIVIGQIKTNVSGYLYLREHSYGNYNGKSWNQAAEYWKTLPGGYSYNYLASIALANMGQSADMAEMKEMAIYMLPYYLGLEGSYEHPTKDTVYDSLLSDYIASYYFLTDVSRGYESLKGYLGDYSQYEEEYRQFVHSTYLTIDSDTRKYMEGIIADQGFDLSDPLVIQKVASYIQHAAKYNLNYDPKMDSEKNVAIAFLDTYKEGICVHYASAATLLYRALNIPARYVEGFTVMTEAGEFVDITTPGHAWVEVYIDGFGWVQVEVTGGSGGGGAGGGSSKQTIVVKPAYQYKVFDYEALVASNELEFDAVLSELLKNNYYYSVTVSGSRIQVGQGVSKVVEFVLYDPNGVDVTDEFDIKIEDGVLEVLPAEKTLIRVYLYQLQKFYDGKSLTFEDLDYEIIDIPLGFELKLELNISLTDVGQITLSEINENLEKFVSFRVYDWRGTEVTENCILVFDTFDFGNHDYIPIRVDARPITVTSASETKVDNGKPLTNKGYTITSGSLAAGHSITVNVIGRVEEVGSDFNYVESVVIKAEDGTDVTANYNVNLMLGELTIIPKDD